MLSRQRIALISFATSSGIIALFGLIYFFSPTFLPHHEAAIGQSWEQVDTNTRVVILSLMRAVGAGWLAAAAALFVILFIPFRQGQRWSRWALLGIGWGGAFPVAYVGISEQVATGAFPPWILPVACIFLCGFGFLFSKDLRPIPVAYPMPPYPPHPWPAPPPPAHEPPAAPPHDEEGEPPVPTKGDE